MPLRKKSIGMLCAFVLIVTLFLGVYFLRHASAEPTCNCMFPNTGEYGVIETNGCVVTKCKRRTQDR